MERLCEEEAKVAAEAAAEEAAAATAAAEKDKAAVAKAEAKEKEAKEKAGGRGTLPIISLEKRKRKRKIIWVPFDARAMAAAASLRCTPRGLVPTVRRRWWWSSERLEPETDELKVSRLETHVVLEK